ncbi:MAG: hypothetical protein QFE16_14270 [Pseudomonadota bacterium]|nr:hypothetical protein [Pseudomonadota bacterium]
MEAPLIDPLVARVLAWHNRHRLACRIAPDQVQGLGVVALPFVPRAASSVPARLRWLPWGWLNRLRRKVASAPRADLVPAFTEDFIAPLTRRRIARFALRHGTTERPGSTEWPQRDVLPDPEVPAASLTVLFLHTACIEKGRRRLRVLVSAAEAGSVLGSRLWSAPRLASAAAVLVIVMAVVTFGAMQGSDELAEVPASPRIESVAVARVVADKPASAPIAAPVPVASAPAAAVASLEIAASAPTDAVAHLALPRIRPDLTAEEREAALIEGRRLRSMEPTHVALPADARVIYAVMTAVTRTRAASEQRHQVMGSSATAGELPGKPHSELMQVGEGWRAVLWPFRSRDEANIARAMLSERGVRTEVLEF